MKTQRIDMIVLLLVQVAIIILFGVFAKYSPDADARTPMNNVTITDVTELAATYPIFQDVHVMMFIGFGFLMTFLNKYGYSAVGFNFLLAAVMIQWCILVRGIYHNHDGKIEISIVTLLEADLTTATMLISMGAVLGKTSPMQLIVMGLIEGLVGVSNEYLALEIFKAKDAGASMVVHVFGAYFGLACSLTMRQGGFIKKNAKKTDEGASYTSDLFAMIGTIFLWLFWPSFNGSLVEGDDRHRAMINTYLSLASCCVTAFAASTLFHKEAKLDMVHIQNATLAGGVAIGTASDMMVTPVGALIVGMIAGLLSVVGYRFLQPCLLRHIGLHDTCGVHNLHGMPGVLAGIVGAVVAGIANQEMYGYSLYLQFPARAPAENTMEFLDYQSHLGTELEPGDNRSAMQQGGYQMLALVVTFVIALASGAVTGFLLNLGCFGKVHNEELFNDEHYWEIPEEDHEKASDTDVS